LRRPDEPATRRFIADITICHDGPANPATHHQIVNVAIHHDGPANPARVVEIKRWLWRRMWRTLRVPINRWWCAVADHEPFMVGDVVTSNDPQIAIAPRWQ
jgi:hypothetical protein